VSEAHEPPPPNAGWYPDPELAHTQRYWDGSKWTDQRAPIEQGASDGLVTAGYVTAVILPLVGFVLGFVLIARKREAHGFACVILSIVAAVVASILLIGNGGSVGRNLPTCADVRSGEAELPSNGKCLE
jgi:hypothetical protein